MVGQILGMPGELEAGMATPGTCRKHNASTKTIYECRVRLRGLELVDVRHPKVLEEENCRLKTLQAETMRGDAILKDVAERERAGDPGSSWMLPRPAKSSHPGLDQAPSARLLPGAPRETTRARKPGGTRQDIEPGPRHSRPLELQWFDALERESAKVP